MLECGSGQGLECKIDEGIKFCSSWVYECFSDTVFECVRIVMIDN